jgi:predicted TPR repeat methyltransferase
VAELHRRIRDPDGAARALEAGVYFQPHDPELRHMLAAARHDATRRRASDEYLVRHFDEFAEAFDTRLHELEYHAPEKLVERLRPHLAGREGTVDILDAGCGTGLLAPLVRDVTRRLVGVDISPKMLDRARERDLYDELHAEELGEFLGRRRGAYDVVVAADVFIYFGDVTELVARMAAALKPDGMIAFSAERHDGQGHELRVSGRWAHSEAELRSAADAAGVRLDIDHDVLRLEYGAPVDGLFAVGRRK